MVGGLPALKSAANAVIFFFFKSGALIFVIILVLSCKQLPLYPIHCLADKIGSPGPFFASRLVVYRQPF